MEPITIVVSLAMLAGRLASRGIQRSCAADVIEARERFDSMRLRCIEHFNELKTELKVLRDEQLACTSWLFPQLLEVLRDLGLHKMVPMKGDLISGRALSKMRRLISAARSSTMLPNGIIDNSVAVASGITLVVRGAQYLDGLGAVDLPQLHDRVSDVLASLPIDHASEAATALGDLGDIGVGDVLGDALLIFGIYKIGRNLRKAHSLSHEREGLETKTRRLQAALTEIVSLQEKTIIARKNLYESSYDAFKWTLIVREMRATKYLRNADKVRRISLRAIEKIDAFWMRLQAVANG